MICFTKTVSVLCQKCAVGYPVNVRFMISSEDGAVRVDQPFFHDELRKWGWLLPDTRHGLPQVICAKCQR